MSQAENKTPPKRTSAILEDLRDDCKDDGKLSVGEFTARLSDRAFGLIIFIFGIINGVVPGVSVIFSIPILIIGVQMILGQQQIWLPKWIANRKVSEAHLKMALAKTVPVLKVLETLIRPRLNFLTTDTAEKFIAVILIALAIVIFLPLPGFNMIPAAAMCVIALGILEKDGLLILIGSIASIIGIWLMSFVIIKALTALFTYVINWIGI